MSDEIDIHGSLAPETFIRLRDWLRSGKSAVTGFTSGVERQLAYVIEQSGLREELSRLRAENERLNLYLRCQADVSAVGTRSSPSALQSSAGEDAGWRPFSTAPEDGTTILVVGYGFLPFLAHFVAAADMVEGGDDVPQWWTTDGQDLNTAALSYWMPLPKGPHIPRPTEEPRSGDTATAAGGDVGLTPHSNPQERTQDG